MFERTSCAPAQGTPMRTALHLWVSIAQQRPDLQADGVHRYAKRAGLDIAAEHMNMAISGRQEGRPQVQARARQQGGLSLGRELAAHSGVQAGGGEQSRLAHGGGRRTLPHGPVLPRVGDLARHPRRARTPGRPAGQGSPAITRAEITGLRPPWPTDHWGPPRRRRTPAPGRWGWIGDRRQGFLIVRGPLTDRLDHVQTRRISGTSSSRVPTCRR
jgi:hypothetical protein